MAQKIHLFKHPTFGEIHVIEKDTGEILFILDEVCKAIGMSKEEALSSLTCNGMQFVDKDNDKKN
jgi:prophage antirepressor-like protein